MYAFMTSQPRPSLNIHNSHPSIGLQPPNEKVVMVAPPKEKVVVVMGATGSGKSKLSLDLAARFSPAEVVNSDKMQVYKGLDVITNRMPEEERMGVPHHLMEVIDPHADFTARDFCSLASASLKSITSRGRLPIIVGGSNSYIEALVDDEDHGFQSRYECCFLWVDVSVPVLHSLLAKRVDRMVEAGMVEEARGIFELNADYSRGIRRSIGVPEFDEAKLACRQLEKIHRFRNVKGWKVHRLNATDVHTKHGKEAEEAWERLVARPGSMIVSRFLHGPSTEGFLPFSGCNYLDRPSLLSSTLSISYHQTAPINQPPSLVLQNHSLSAYIPINVAIPLETFFISIHKLGK